MTESAFSVRHQRTAEFAAIPSAVSAARRETVQTLKDWGLLELIDVAELLVSELITNAVQATGLTREPTRYSDLAHVSGVLLQLRRAEFGVRILVWDRDPRPPILGRVDAEGESGRGLFLVAAIAQRWGHYRPVYGGKVVWAEVAAE